VVGATNPFITPDWQRGAVVEMAQNFDALDTDYTFVANHFRNVSISLDQNDYYGNVFESCTFLYTGGPRISYGNNTETNCTIEIAPGVEHIPAVVNDLRRRCQPTSSSTPKRLLLKTPHWTTTRISPTDAGRK
jgi:hypothetical protein